MKKTESSARVKSLLPSFISISFFILFVATTASAFTSTFATTALASTFSDVDDTQIYSAGIEFLTQQGIIKGYDNGTYKPSAELNRAELLKIIAEGSAKYSNKESSIFAFYKGKKCFSDVKANQWYTKYICYAKEKGWVTGYNGGKLFKPDQKVTFVEALKMTFKGFDIKFDETAKVWYRDLIDQASNANYIPFDITGFMVNLRRDQMADLVTRIIKSNDSLKVFNAYLGLRADVVVTYETLRQGLELSKLQIETK